MASEGGPGVTLSIWACAKINLTLRLTGRRSDGYHDLRTVLQSVALHDTLRFRATRGPFRIECDDPACPTDRANLVWRAADHVWRAAGRRGRPRGVVVTIEKRIPLAAGLGGGSSDAAAALRALSRVWRVDLALDQQRAIAASLGADVPFFLEGGTALGVGRGDVVFPLMDTPPAWVVVVIPPFGVSTQDAYGWWDSPSGRKRGLPRLFGLPAGELGNDLEAPVAARHPEIARIGRELQRLGAMYAAMSGSGSAVFGLFTSKAAADRAARRSGLRNDRALVTRSVGRTEYRRVSMVRARAAWRLAG